MNAPLSRPALPAIRRFVAFIGNQSPGLRNNLISYYNFVGIFPTLIYNGNPASQEQPLYPE